MAPPFAPSSLSCLPTPPLRWHLPNSWAVNSSIDSLHGFFTLQVAINGTVKWLLKTMICASIPVCCTVGAYLALDGDASYTEKYSVIWPSVAVFVISLLVAQGITVSLTCCIDTIYVCAFEAAALYTLYLMTSGYTAAFSRQPHLAAAAAPRRQISSHS